MSQNYGFLSYEDRLTHTQAEEALEQQVAFVEEVAGSFVRIVVNGKSYALDVNWRDEDEGT